MTKLSCKTWWLHPDQQALHGTEWIDKGWLWVWWGGRNIATYLKFCFPNSRKFSYFFLAIYNSQLYSKLYFGKHKWNTLKKILTWYLQNSVSLVLRFLPGNFFITRKNEISSQLIFSHSKQNQKFNQYLKLSINYLLERVYRKQQQR